VLKHFLLLAFMILFSTISNAEIVKSVVVTGAKKTTIEAVQRHARIRPGDNLDQERMKEIRENLLRVPQINLKSLDFKDGVLTVDIEDKWTIYPVPMITQSGNYYSRGALLYDDNFFGSLGTFVPAITWTNAGMNAILYYQDETFFTPQYGFKILAMRRNQLTDFKRGGDTNQQFESRMDTLLFTPNFLWKDHVFKGGPIYLKKEVLSMNGQTLMPRDEAKGFWFRHHWDYFQKMDVMYRGFITTYNFLCVDKSSGGTVLFHDADVAVSIPIKQSFVNFQVHGHYTNEETYLYPKLVGGSEGHRGYDKDSLPLQANAGLMIQHQQHLFNRVFFSPFYEFNTSKLIKPVYAGQTLNESTVGAGIRYYFQKISIPAIIVDYARNFDDKSSHVLVNIGLMI